MRYLLFFPFYVIKWVLMLAFIPLSGFAVMIGTVLHEQGKR